MRERTKELRWFFFEASIERGMDGVMGVMGAQICFGGWTR